MKIMDMNDFMEMVLGIESNNSATSTTSSQVCSNKFINKLFLEKIKKQLSSVMPHSCFFSMTLIFLMQLLLNHRPSNSIHRSNSQLNFTHTCSFRN